MDIPGWAYRISHGRGRAWYGYCLIGHPATEYELEVILIHFGTLDILPVNSDGKLTIRFLHFVFSHKGKCIYIHTQLQIGFDRTVEDTEIKMSESYKTL